MSIASCWMIVPLLLATISGIMAFHQQQEQLLPRRAFYNGGGNGKKTGVLCKAKDATAIFHQCINRNNENKFMTQYPTSLLATSPASSSSSSPFLPVASYSLSEVEEEEEEEGEVIISNDCEQHSVLDDNSHDNNDNCNNREEEHVMNSHDNNHSRNHVTQQGTIPTKAAAIGSTITSGAVFSSIDTFNNELKQLTSFNTTLISRMVKRLSPSSLSSLDSSSAMRQGSTKKDKQLDVFMNNYNLSIDSQFSRNNLNTNDQEEDGLVTCDTIKLAINDIIQRTEIAQELIFFQMKSSIIGTTTNSSADTTDITEVAAPATGIVQPNYSSYNIVLRGWKKVVQNIVASCDVLNNINNKHLTLEMTAMDAALQAERLLHHMEEVSSSLQPQQQQQQLEQHNNQRQKKASPLQPTMESFMYVMGAIHHVSLSSSSSSSSSLYNPKRNIALAEKMNTLFTNMKERYNIQPNAKSYEYVIGAWSRISSTSLLKRNSGGAATDAAERAQDVLNELEQVQYNCQNSNDNNNSINSSRCNKGSSQNKNNLRPTMSMYKSVFKAWSNHIQDRILAAEMSQALIDRMCKLHTDHIIDFTPDTPCYNAAIDAWRRTGIDDAALKCENLLIRLEDQGLTPYVNTYTSVIQAWANRARTDDKAPDRAEELLRTMERWSVTDHPRVISNKENNDIDSNHDDDGDDDDIKQNIIETHPSRKPNVRTYTAVINAWGRSRRDDVKAAKALQLLKEMNDLVKLINRNDTTENDGDGHKEQIRPNLFTYNSVINACATCRFAKPQQKDRALKIAFAVLKALQQNRTRSPKGAPRSGNGTEDLVIPNHVTYGTLLKAAYNLIPMGKERNDVVRAVFDKCKREGQVDEGVMKQFRQSADRELFYEVLSDLQGVIQENGVVHVECIPPEWKRNVKKIK